MMRGATRVAAALPPLLSLPCRVLRRGPGLSPALSLLLTPTATAALRARLTPASWLRPCGPGLSRPPFPFVNGPFVLWFHLFRHALSPCQHDWPSPLPGAGAVRLESDPRQHRWYLFDSGCHALALSMLVVLVRRSSCPPEREGPLGSLRRHFGAIGCG